MDIVERLRDDNSDFAWYSIAEEAADEIERLRENLSFAVQIMRSAPVTFTSNDGMKFYDEAVEKLARVALQQNGSE